MNLHDDPDDVEYRTAVELQMRNISDEKFHKLESYAAEIFSARSEFFTNCGLQRNET